MYFPVRVSLWRDGGSAEEIQTRSTRPSLNNSEFSKDSQQKLMTTFVPLTWKQSLKTGE